MWDSLQAPVEAGDFGTYVGWLRENGAGLPPDTLARILTTYHRLLGDPQRALAEAIAGLLLGRDPAPDLADLPEANGESVRQRLSHLSDTPAWQEAGHYFAMRD